MGQGLNFLWGSRGSSTRYSNRVTLDCDRVWIQMASGNNLSVESAHTCRSFDSSFTVMSITRPSWNWVTSEVCWEDILRLSNTNWRVEWIKSTSGGLGNVLSALGRLILLDNLTWREWYSSDNLSRANWGSLDHLARANWCSPDHLSRTNRCSSGGVLSQNRFNWGMVSDDPFTWTMSDDLTGEHWRWREDAFNYSSCWYWDRNCMLMVVNFLDQFRFADYFFLQFISFCL